MTESIDSEALRDAIRDVLRDRLELGALRRFLEDGPPIDAGLWRTAGELGWPGLAVPEAFGGSALGFDALAVLHEEAGRHLAPLPLLPTALAAEALVAAGNLKQQSTWLPAIARGECIASVASPADALDRRLPKLAIKGAGLVLRGESAGLLDPCGAKLLVVFASDESGATRALLVEPQADGIAPERVEVADRTRHLGRLAFAGLELPAERLLAGDGRALAARLLVHASLALACDSVGGAERIFELTIDYLKTRRQFDRPIGSFQALKHRAANLKVLIEASSATVREAVGRATSTDASQWASMAKFYGADAYAAVAADAIQLHGGIGFTWEHHAHLFLKRAKLNQQACGGPEWHRDRAARLLAGREAA